MLNAGVRPLPAEVHTVDFRVFGNVHLRANTGTAWLLNAEDRPSLTVTQAKVHAASIDEPVERAGLLHEPAFLAIPKGRILWVAGGDLDRTLSGQGRVMRRITLLYADYLLRGTAPIRPELRLSDALGQIMHTKPFLTLHDVRVERPAADGERNPRGALVREHEHVSVNLRLVGGIFDERDGRP
ncbi:hypothetical protein BH23DEI1_BH23DEI1_02460 [soil metagenome]